MNREPWLDIWKVNRGYVAKRGCKYLVFLKSEHDKMKEAFSDLLDNEDHAAGKWCDHEAHGCEM